MKAEHNSGNSSLPHKLGRAAFRDAMNRFDVWRGCERQRREKASEAPRATLGIRLASLVDLYNELKDMLGKLPSIGIPAQRSQYYFYYFSAALLACGSVTFIYLALSNFGFSALSTFFLSVIITTGLAFFTATTLKKCKSERLLKTVCVVGCIAGLAAVLTIAVVQGEFVSHFVTSALASTNSSTVDSTVVAGKVYQETTWKLQLLFLFLAFALDAGAGVAFHEAEVARALSSSGAAERIRKEFKNIEDEICRVVEAQIVARNDADIFDLEARRDFVLGLLEEAGRTSESARDTKKGERR